MVTAVTEFKVWLNGGDQKLERPLLVIGLVAALIGTIVVGFYAGLFAVLGRSTWNTLSHSFHIVVMCALGSKFSTIAIYSGPRMFVPAFAVG